MDIFRNPFFRDEVPQLATSAGRSATGMHALVHEDCEHLTTTQFARKNEFIGVS